jgi:2,3-bisphosphoglycerate-dependent phosphoglycerate mutase/probable phosphoglycerate mutase
MLDHLYTSAMIRTMQTTQPISKALGLAPEIWVDIHEHGGVYLEHNDERGTVGYPGLGRGALLERFPGYVLPDNFSEDGWWSADKGAEPVNVAHGRAIGVAAALCNRRSEDSRIGLVSHGGFIDSLLKALFNLLPSPALALEHQNTAITRLAFASDGKIAMDFMNHTEHLTDELLT